MRIITLSGARKGLVKMMLKNKGLVDLRMRTNAAENGSVPRGSQDIAAESRHRTRQVNEIISPRQKRLLSLAKMAYDEMIVDLVGCWCGAKPGEYCRGAYKLHCKTLHVDRRDDAKRKFKRMDPKGWQRLKDETFQRIVKQLDAPNATA